MTGGLNGQVNGAASPAASLKWDPKTVEIKTISAEKTLQSLVMQVTTLVNTKVGPSNKKKGRSKRAQILVAAVEQATEHFIKTGETFVAENPDNKADLMAALDEVKRAGEQMSVVRIDRLTVQP